MSTTQSVLLIKANSANRKEQWHGIRVRLTAVVSFACLASLLAYGAGYYRLSLEERPFSEQHALLRPGGAIGLKLGIVGTVLFCIIFLYALRKVIPWLGRIGSTRHWMDFHVIAGVSAPILIAMHASFKFRGIAGVAYLIMVAVAVSGIIGRYLYSQIPRSLSAAELSLNDLAEQEKNLAEALKGQSVYSSHQLELILRARSAQHIRSINPLVAIAEMLLLDLRRPFQIASLRRSSISWLEAVRCAGGMVGTSNPEVERIVMIVRHKAALSKRILFLDHTHRVFHLWHVIHRPFSYAFAALAIMHIIVVMGLGFL